MILKGEIPQVTTATCDTVVKAYKIHKDDFLDHFPLDIIKKTDKDVFRKLYQLRDKLVEEN